MTQFKKWKCKSSQAYATTDASEHALVFGCTVRVLTCNVHAVTFEKMSRNGCLVLKCFKSDLVLLLNVLSLLFSMLKCVVVVVFCSIHLQILNL